MSPMFDVQCPKSVALWTALAERGGDSAFLRREERRRASLVVALQKTAGSSQR